ncbi:methyltransferase domain-containing protein, partial [Patescibacteria group bacterium]|nr:methyltransferase domain-containing protein [Patescibacteria group bacterium]
MDSCIVKTVKQCRSCGHRGLERIVSLGDTPLANALSSEIHLAEKQKRHPLDLGVCPTCSLVQLLDSVPPEDLFSEYLYFSSFSESFINHARSIADRFIEQLRLDSGSLVVEVGSNDGYLLQFFKQKGIPVLGIEPARNIARFAREEKDIETLNDFFGRSLAEQLAQKGLFADLIIANNVLAHVNDSNGVVSGMRKILKPNGVISIQTPYLIQMLDHTE